MTHILTSGRAYLRPIERSGAERYRRWRADAEPKALAGWRPGTVSLVQVEARIERLAKADDRSVMTFVICLLADDRPVGEVMLFEIDHRNGSAELGIFIGEADQWGKGYGTDAIRAMVDDGFGNLRLERIWPEVWTENARARRAYKKAGFVHEGTLRNDRFEGGRQSGDIMSILRDAWQSRS